MKVIWQILLTGQSNYRIGRIWQATGLFFYREGEEDYRILPLFPKHSVKYQKMGYSLN